MHYLIKPDLYDIYTDDRINEKHFNDVWDFILNLQRYLIKGIRVFGYYYL